MPASLHHGEERDHVELYIEGVQALRRHTLLS